MKKKFSHASRYILLTVLLLIYISILAGAYQFF